jgi:RNA polymerase sigma factor (sigma-70 family)
MNTPRAETVRRDLDALFHLGVVGGMSDGQLLERFMSRGQDGGQTAFEEVVRRHGSMVLGVCLRALGDSHAAEDAFQATFLVLALKARSVRKADSLGPWLHGVAARVARRALLLSRRRKEQALPAEDLAGTSFIDPELVELRAILDEELERLPEKYRRPLVLCYLEGQTQDQAAQALGWTKGTVSGRLARAKELLRSRLMRRGLASSAAVVGAFLAPEVATAAVPSSLLLPTVRAAMAASLAGMEGGLGVGSGQAAALARGILKTMYLGKLKAAVPLLLLTLGGAAVSAPMLWNFRSAGPLPARAAIPTGAAQPWLLPLVVGVGFTPDGKTALSAQSDGLVRLWDPASGQPVGTINLVENTEGGREGESVVRAFALSPDGRLMAGVGRVRDNSTRRMVQRVWIWSLDERRPLSRIDVETHELQSMAFSPEGASVATGDDSGRIQLWDVAAGEELLTLRLGETAIRGIAFSPDGMTLAATDLASGVQLWDLGGGRALGAVDAGSQPHALHPCFSPDGTLLAFDTPGGEVIIWDRAGGRQRARTRVAPQGSLAIAFAPDSQTLAVCGEQDGTMAVLDTLTGRQHWNADLGHGPTTGLAYSPDGKAIVASHDGTLSFLDSMTGKPYHAH